MSILRCTDNGYDNARMTAAGYEIIAVETWTWQDGVSETEILWGRDEQPIGEADLPY